VDAVSVAHFRQLLDQQGRLRQVAEARAREARQALLRVAQTLCQEAVDQARKDDPAGMERWEAGQIADFIVAHLTGPLFDLELARRVGEDRSLLQQARENNAGLRRRLDETARQRDDVQRGWQREQEAHRQTKAELRSAHSQVKVLKESLSTQEKQLRTALANVETQKVQLKALQAQPQAAHRWPAPQVEADTEPLVQVRLHPLPTTSEPDWMQAWRQHTNFERTSRLILALGESGECRRPRLARMVAGMLGLNDHNDNRVRRTFTYAQQAGLIEIIAFKQIVSGSSPHLVKLTQQGGQAYRYLTGQDAAPSVYDLLRPRHKTDAHIFLNLEAADLLALAGYQPDLYPQAEFELVDGGKFRPDLRATAADGEVLWVEVERDPAKYGQANPQRMRKWDIYHQATGGNFYLITSDPSAMKHLRQEIAFWAAQSGRSVNLWLTNVSEAQGKRGPDGTIWLVEEHY